VNQEEVQRRPDTPRHREKLLGGKRGKNMFFKRGKKHPAKKRKSIGGNVKLRLRAGPLLAQEKGGNPKKKGGWHLSAGGGGAPSKRGEGN